MNDVTSQDLFNRWLAYLREEGSDKYVNSKRMAHLDILMEFFFNMKFDHDEAKTYKKKVMTALTHEEGRKGKGKYSGWKECVEADFDACAANWYVKVLESDEEDNRMVKGTEVIDFEDLMPDDPAIRAWLIEKYGKSCTKSLVKKAHTIGNMLNLEYLTDRFK